ncbi:MAG: isoleucine--tRNA ligase [Acidobacteriota bacterium]
MDIRSTLNLPRTDFKMKADLPQREPQFIEQWDKGKLYQKIRQLRQKGKSCVLHDGPPYANGRIHLGTALNKILKDFVVKSKTMMGYNSPYLPGWDCHGLPIEHQVDKILGAKKKDMTTVEIREKCRQFGEKYAAIQRDEFKRLGILGEWEKPYLTLHPSYEATIVKQFGKFLEKGNVYRGYKPVHWCIHCRTALAEAEVEYLEHESPSIYVAFPLKSDISQKLPSLADKRIYLLIWTTTPWTLPANLAIALNPALSYVAVEVGEDVFIVARGLLEETAAKCRWKDYKILETFKGDLLEGLHCRHPFIRRDSLIILADHVTLEQGTGCVHTAPGHGLEDFLVSGKYGLEVYNPVGDDGRFIDEVEHFAGMEVFEANGPICDLMEHLGVLLSRQTVAHAYPHCWRCKNPIIFRATAQWFISLETNQLRDKALQEIKKARWLPAWGEERIANMVANRPDWCISRQRVWGVPITIFYCQKCQQPLMDSKVANWVADIFAREGSNAWFIKEAHALLPPGTTCPDCGGTAFSKEKDIIDVWFESGVSHEAVLGHRSDLPWPCDIYLEGSDQYRGWFQSSLLVAVQSRGQAPYRTVITHGFFVDGEGKKMSKSLGNYIEPDEIINQYGAEILRLWVSMMDYREDMRISHEIIARIAESYRKIRNTCRFILGNLYDFDPRSHLLPAEELSELDRWALFHFYQLTDRIIKAYDSYEYHTVYHSINNFSAVEMSAFYLDILKDRLYTSAPDSPGRRSAQTVLYLITDGLARLMAPILSFTAEEVWQFIPSGAEKPESVHLTTFPEPQLESIDQELITRWERLIALRQEVYKALEIARNKKLIGHSLDARVTLSLPEGWKGLIDQYLTQLPEILIVSAVELGEGEGGELYHSTEIEGLRIRVNKAEWEKCERCWNYSPSVSDNREFPTLCRRCVGVVKKILPHL